MIVDANVLLYAVDRESAFHETSRSFLEEAFASGGRVGFPWVSLTAFQRIATHPRVSARPLTAAEAWSFVAEWVAADVAWIPSPTNRHADILGRLLLDGDLRGNLVTDAHLAALAIEHGVPIASFDSDFARFNGLTWVVPGKA